MDRWAGSSGGDDRWAQSDRNFDGWARSDRQHDRWADNEPQYDRWADDEPQYNRWADADREYDHLAQTAGVYDGRARLASYTQNPKVKWVGLFVAWVIVTGILLAVHLTILIWVIMFVLIGYVIYGVLRDTPRAPHQRRRNTTTTAQSAGDDRERFNAPPGWPEPPPGWTPPPGWRPNPAWPPAPPGWQFWLPAARRGHNVRAGRARHYGSEPDDYRFTDGWR